MRMTFAKFTRERREGAAFAGSPGLRENTVYENEVPFLLRMFLFEQQQQLSRRSPLPTALPSPPKGFLLRSKIGSSQYENVTWQSKYDL